MAAKVNTDFICHIHEVVLKYVHDGAGKWHYECEVCDKTVQPHKELEECVHKLFLYNGTLTCEKCNLKVTVQRYKGTGCKYGCHVSEPTCHDNGAFFAQTIRPLAIKYGCSTCGTLYWRYVE